jgi:hypothetical protein
MQTCTECERLHDEVRDVLARIAQLTTAQLAAFRSNDNAAFMRFDKELEIAMGAKERAIGALRQHERDHNY